MFPFPFFIGDVPPTEMPAIPEPIPLTQNYGGQGSSNENNKLEDKQNQVRWSCSSTPMFVRQDGIEGKMYVSFKFVSGGSFELDHYFDDRLINTYDIRFQGRGQYRSPRGSVSLSVNKYGRFVVLIEPVSWGRTYQLTGQCEVN